MSASGDFDSAGSWKGEIQLRFGLCSSLHKIQWEFAHEPLFPSRLTHKRNGSEGVIIL